MSKKQRRRKDRLFKRVPVRFGLEKPEHSASGVQITSQGLFIATNNPVYTSGVKLVLELKVKGTLLTLRGVVRHANKVPPQVAQLMRPGMGVEFFDISEETAELLDSI